jgi:hypothetical protein
MVNRALTRAYRTLPATVRGMKRDRAREFVNLEESVCVGCGLRSIQRRDQ